MIIENFKKVIALVLCIGALPVLFPASASAKKSGDGLRVTGDGLAATEKPHPTSPQGRRIGYRGRGTGDGLWDDYKKPVGLTYSAQVTVNTTYNWRGIYSGGWNIQPVASVGYGGAYVGTWWNIGATDYAFSGFLPEMDWKIGFNRWGIDLSLLYVHFLDRTNLDLGLFSSNSMEVALRYTLSPKLPLSILWATRVAGGDGYINAHGDAVRAYSTYIEISYTHSFRYGLSLYGAFGISPWRSIYSAYKRDFTAHNIDIRLTKNWDVSTHCGLMLQGQVTINPSELAANPQSAQWKWKDPFGQAINANLAFGVFLK